MDEQRKLIRTDRMSMRWGEMDALGHMHNVSYLRYFEEVRIAWFKSLELEYTVVSEETGILCPAKDDKAFGIAIDRILSSPEWEAKLAKAARDRVEKMFSWDGVARQLSELYDALLEQSAKKLELISSR